MLAEFFYSLNCTLWICQSEKNIIWKFEKRKLFYRYCYYNNNYYRLLFSPREQLKQNSRAFVQFREKAGVVDRLITFCCRRLSLSLAPLLLSTSILFSVIFHASERSFFRSCANLMNCTNFGTHAASCLSRCENCL